MLKFRSKLLTLSLLVISPIFAAKKPAPSPAPLPTPAAPSAEFIEQLNSGLKALNEVIVKAQSANTEASTALLAICDVEQQKAKKARALPTEALDKALKANSNLPISFMQAIADFKKTNVADFAARFSAFPPEQQEIAKDAAIHLMLNNFVFIYPPAEIQKEIARRNEVVRTEAIWARVRIGDPVGDVIKLVRGRIAFDIETFESKRILVEKFTADFLEAMGKAQTVVDLQRAAHQYPQPVIDAVKDFARAQASQKTEAN